MNRAERPILFSAPMVRALLAGTKTQTRRALRPQPLNIVPFIGADGLPTWKFGACTHHHGVIDRHVKCPYGQPGDRLWVREAWRIGAWNEVDEQIAVDYADGPDKNWRQVPLTPEGQEMFDRLWIQSSNECLCKGVRPNIDGNYRWKLGESPLRWRPSIHMPRWASRITLDITSVRVERLHDISAADALAEGVSVHPDHHGKPATSLYGPVQAYRDLWEQINGPDSWAANPWVWVICFKRVTP